MSDQHHVVGVKTYLGVILALMALTGVTVAAAFQDFGPLNNVIMLAIAFVKAFLVAAIFMHLKYSARINWVFAASGLLFFLIMIGFVVGDYKGKAWQYRAQPWLQPATPPAAAAAPAAAAPAAH